MIRRTLLLLCFALELARPAVGHAQAQAPDPDRQTYPGDEDDDERRKKTPEERARHRWLYSGNAKRGVEVGYSGGGYYQPRVFREVELLLPDPPGAEHALPVQQVEIGVRNAWFPVEDGQAREWRAGLRFAWAQGKAADGSTVQMNMPSLYGGYTWQLHRAYRGTDFLHIRPQFYIPLELEYAWITARVSGKAYTDLGVSLASGLGLRLYTLTPVVFDLSLRYRAGFGADALNNGTDSKPDYLLGPSGKKIRGNPSGLEPRVTLELHLPAKAR